MTSTGDRVAERDAGGVLLLSVGYGRTCCVPAKRIKSVKTHAYSHHIVETGMWWNPHNLVSE